MSTVFALLEEEHLHVAEGLLQLTHLGCSLRRLPLDRVLEMSCKRATLL